jgi:hypothetical protein
MCTQRNVADVVKKVKVPVQKTWRPTAEDVKLLADLKARTGMVNETDILRLALRALAQKEGVAA